MGRARVDYWQSRYRYMYTVVWNTSYNVSPPKSIFIYGVSDKHGVHQTEASLLCTFNDRLAQKSHLDDLRGYRQKLLVLDHAVVVVVRLCHNLQYVVRRQPNLRAEQLEHLMISGRKIRAGKPRLLEPSNVYVA